MQHLTAPRCTARLQQSVPRVAQNRMRVVFYLYLVEAGIILQPARRTLSHQRWWCLSGKLQPLNRHKILQRSPSDPQQPMSLRTTLGANTCKALPTCINLLKMGLGMRSCRLRCATQQHCCTATGAAAMYRDTTPPSSYVVHTLLLNLLTPTLEVKYRPVPGPPLDASVPAAQLRSTKDTRSLHLGRSRSMGCKKIVPAHSVWLDRAGARKTPW